MDELEGLTHNLKPDMKHFHKKQSSEDMPEPGIPHSNSMTLLGLWILSLYSVNKGLRLHLSFTSVGNKGSGGGASGSYCVVAFQRVGASQCPLYGFGLMDIWLNPGRGA